MTRTKKGSNIHRPGGIASMVFLSPKEAHAARVRAERTRSTFAPTSRVVRIVGSNNGAGLSRDRDILAERFRDVGWEVIFAELDAPTSRDATVTVHLERFAQQFIGTSQRDILVPNPEWWALAQNGLLRQPTVVVWAKTSDAVRLFRSRADRVELLGFTSRDRRLPDVPRKRAFLHLAGGSPNKATEVLFRVWRREWPELTVVKWADKPIRNGVPNIRVIQDRLSDAEVLRLQNEHLFHVYPSRYEGFGHAQWEGLSCGAVVMVAEGPMWPAPFWAVPSDAAPRSVGIADMRAVRESALIGAINDVLTLNDDIIAQGQQAGRRAWEENRDVFFGNAYQLIDDLAPRPVTYAQASSVLSDLPPMLYAGRVACLTGQGEAARHQIHALRQHGLALRILDTGSVGDPDRSRVDPFVQAARVSSVTQTPGGTIIHLQPNTAETHRVRCPRPHVIVSVWETTRLPAAWVPLLNTYDQVWCPTEWQAQVYRDSGVSSRLLRVVPFAFDSALFPVDGAELAGVRRPAGVTFGSVFQWTERKNPTALLRAFAKAFTADDRVRLVLKTYEGDDASAAGVLRHVAKISAKHAGTLPEIQVLASALGRQDVLAFHRALDCYVSAHCGEGFGIPIVEALLLGRSVIATNWSAPAEYAAGFFTGVDYRLAPPHGMDWQPFYTPDQQWARIDEDRLAEAMRACYEGRLAAPNVVAVRAHFDSVFASVGSAARAALETLR